jgi:tetratricopeptide (TPR) repeat protein
VETDFMTLSAALSTRLLWLIMITVLFVLTTPRVDLPQAVASDLETAKSLIAMVQVKQYDTIRVGAAIVIGHRHRKLYLVTAGHLIRKQGQPSADLKVSIRLTFAPGEKLAAHVLADYDSSLDLAVIRIQADDSLLQALGELSFPQTSSPKKLRPVENLRVIGNPYSNAWHVGLRYDFSSLDGAEVRFTPGLDFPGFSGGGLFNAEWQLVGMVTKTDPLVGIATNVDDILAKLRDWNYPVTLSPADTATATTGTVVDETDTGTSVQLRILLKLDRIRNLLDVGNYEKALREATDLTEFAPKCAPCQIMKARAHLRLGERTSALRALDAALQSEPGNTDAIIRKSALLIDIADYSGAIRLLNELLQSESWNTLARYNLGLAYLLNRQYPQANNHYSAVLESPREDLRPGAALGLGLSVLLTSTTTSSISQATNHFRRAICLKSDLVKVLRGQDFADHEENYARYAKVVQGIFSEDYYQTLLAKVENYTC